jgi:hypothetical protein
MWVFFSKTTKNSTIGTYFKYKRKATIINLTKKTLKSKIKVQASTPKNNRTHTPSKVASIRERSSKKGKE